jgi:hypothetical protein
MQTEPNSVVLREYKVPRGGTVKIHIPTFWLTKNKVRVIELCENATTGSLEIRVKEPKPEPNTGALVIPDPSKPINPETGEPLAAETT